MPWADPIPSFPPGGAPVSILLDYDGTISLVDVGDALLARFVADRAAVRMKDAQYDAGILGSRELLVWDMDVLDASGEALLAAVGPIPQDETLRDLVDVARSVGAAMEVVSDGMGFYIEENLARLGAGSIPVATNRAVAGGPGSLVTFPYGHPSCFVCGTCKRERVRLHHAAGRLVVFVGDGTSDRFAAAHADVVFGKRKLAAMCDAEGWPYQPWERLGDVAAWLAAAWTDGRLPVDASGVAQWRGCYGPAPRAFICGPEVWGEGRTTPGPGPGRG